ncbi:MAG: hypothetical protein D4R97_04830 [Bacteroidetes bacterium]|nr:MAG: hypothetical protein D4R97_04830 [Bacteroidota bacterium]
MIQQGIAIRWESQKITEKMRNKEKRQPQNRQSGKTFVCCFSIRLASEFLEYRAVGRIIFLLIGLYEFIGKIVIDEKCRQVGIISFSVAVDGTVPCFAGMFEKKKEQDITNKDKFWSIFQHLLHG